MLHEVVREHLETFLAQAREDAVAGCHATWRTSSAATSRAVSCPRGRPSQTQYNSRSTPTQVKLVRRHHPLEGQLLDVVTGGPAQVVEQHPAALKPLSKDFAARMEALVKGTKVDLDAPIDGEVDL